MTAATKAESVMILAVGLLYFLLTAVPAVEAAGARLRGKHFNALEAMVRDPKIDEAIRGKTLKELGLEQYTSNAVDEDLQARRNMQGETTLKYFTLYDEFDTTHLNITDLGATAGSRGLIYDYHAKDNGLIEEHIEGALQGTCSLVSSDKKQLCSYEMFLLNPADGSLGTLVATGTVSHEIDSNSVLIIEATGDEFSSYRGGMVIIKYTAIGEQTVMDIEIALRR